MVGCIALPQCRGEAAGGYGEDTSVYDVFGEPPLQIETSQRVIISLYELLQYYSFFADWYMVSIVSELEALHRADALLNVSGMLKFFQQLLVASMVTVFFVLCWEQICHGWLPFIGDSFGSLNYHRRNKRENKRKQATEGNFSEKEYCLYIFPCSLCWTCC